mmetsp:Transcript_35124/g.94272  ORF Transcript_35124/g.94272 Transcript_35124/m.94272 type:complete len:260 (+) Transcript_35124:1170-1949(+)
MLAGPRAEQGQRHERPRERLHRDHGRQREGGAEPDRRERGHLHLPAGVRRQQGGHLWRPADHPGVGGHHEVHRRLDGQPGWRREDRGDLRLQALLRHGRRARQVRGVVGRGASAPGPRPGVGGQRSHRRSAAASHPLLLSSLLLPPGLPPAARPARGGRAGRRAKPRLPPSFGGMPLPRGIVSGARRLAPAPAPRAAAARPPPPSSPSSPSPPAQGRSHPCRSPSSAGRARLGEPASPLAGVPLALKRARAGPVPGRAR